MGSLLQSVMPECENPHHVTRGFNSQMEKSGQEQGLLEIEAEVLSGPRSVVGLHWLRGSVLDVHRKWLVDRMCILFGPEYEENTYGFWKFDRHYRWPCGAMVLFHSTDEGADVTAGRIAVEVPGKALEALDTWYIGQFLTALGRHGFQASRIDLFYDDHRRLITPSRLYGTIYEKGLFDDDPLKMDFAHFRVITPKTRAKRGVGIVHDELTFGLRGSAGGGKYLRFYDKALESDGDNRACRWELELSRHKAKQAFEKIVAAFGPESDKASMADVIGRMIGGSIDFVERTSRAGDKNLGRLKRYHFWQVILESLGRATLATKIVVKTIQTAKAWVSKQVVGTLQMLTEAEGRAEFVGFIVDKCLGRDRLRPHHEQIIAEYRQQQAAGRADPLGAVLAGVGVR